MATSNKDFSEIGRKLLHISMGAFAFLLRYLSWEGALLCAVAAFLNNILILPRLTAKFYREGQPKDIGIIFYPISVFFLILFFPDRMYLAAGLWAIMALGDGLATIVGKKYGSAKLPWSRDKSWAGSIAYVIAAALGCSLLIWWTIHPLPEGESALFFFLTLPVLLAVFSALMESLPFGVNDNLLVPMVGAFAAYMLVKIYETRIHTDWAALLEPRNFPVPFLLEAFLVALALGTVSFALRLVSKKGYIAGIFAGTLIYAFTDWRGFLILAVFFIVGSALTKFGYRQKEKLGLAQEDKGARGSKHVIANVTLPMILALVYFLSGFELVFAVAFAAALATALSDTSGSEFGQLYGKKAFMITTFRKVPRGTDGAISREGTLASFVAPFIIVVAAFFSKFVYLIVPALIIGVAAFIGSTAESYMNALIKNKAEADNELMNFLNTVTGAGAAILLFYLIL